MLFVHRFVFESNGAFQLRKDLEPPPGVRRSSNSGFRKTNVKDRILLFLVRMRRRMPFEGLRIMFGVSIGTAHAYYREVLESFHKHVVPRLLRPLSANEIARITPKEFARDLPGAVFVVDLTSFGCKGKGNVSLARVLYSAYHHQHEKAAVFGEKQQLFDVFSSVLIHSFFSLQSLLPTDCSCIDPNSLEGSARRLFVSSIQAT